MIRQWEGRWHELLTAMKRDLTGPDYPRAAIESPRGDVKRSATV
jgi:hypothetical protein